jgi:hypothetical protein
MTTETPPDWVLLEAAKRSGMKQCPDWIKRCYDHHAVLAFRALCNMIQKYEKPPVDRKLLCAQEAVRLHNERHVFSHGLHTPEEVCVRAIELWEECFGYEDKN